MSPSDEARARAFPELPPVRVRSAGFSHEGPVRTHNEDAYSILDDGSAAQAIVVDGGGMLAAEAAALVVETSERLFRGRHQSILDELAETWWRAEHGAPVPGRARVRPYSALPIADRVSLRERIRDLLATRKPEAIGDVTVLEEEANALLGIPRRALAAASDDIHRRARGSSSWRGSGATAACILLGGGRAAIAYVGDCRIYRVRGFAIEALTRDHTLRSDLLRAQPGLTPEQIAELPGNVPTRILGMDQVEIDADVVDLERGDVFVLASAGLWAVTTEREFVTAVRARGIDAAQYLVDRGIHVPFERYGDNLTALVLEVI